MGVGFRMVWGSYYITTGIFLALAIRHCSSLDLEEDPITVLEKLIEEHKAFTPAILDSTSSNSEHHFAKEKYSPQPKPNHGPKNPFQQPTQDQKIRNQTKPVRMRIRESTPPIVLAGRLKYHNKPPIDPNDEKNTMSRQSGKTDKSRKKDCNTCGDENDWVPLDREIKDDAESSVDDEDTSAERIKTKLKDGKVKSLINDESIDADLMKGEEEQELTLFNKKQLFKKPGNEKTMQTYDLKQKSFEDFPESTRMSPSLNGRQRFTIRKGRPVRLDIKVELKDIGREPSSEFKRVPRRNQKAKFQIEERSGPNNRFADFSLNQFGPFNDFGIDFDFPKTTFAKPHAKLKVPTKTKYKIPKDPSSLYVEDPWKNIDKI